MKDHIKGNIASIILVIFIAVKLTGLHGLSHEWETDHIHDCPICSIAISNHDHTPLITSNTEAVTFLKQIRFTENKIVTGYILNYPENTFYNSLFSRPPPIS